LLWFGFRLLFTSHVRWLIGLFYGLVRGGWLVILPPFFSIQYLFSLRDLQFIRVSTSSYFDWATIHEIFVRQEYSTDSFNIHLDILSEYNKIAAQGPPLILDLGANIGIASRFFASTYPAATIVAVEPSTLNARLLRANCLDKENVRVIQAAVGAESGVVSLYDPGKGNNAFRTTGNVSEFIEKIPRYSIMNLLQSETALTPFIVKIDIEGGEKELFDGNIDWVDQFKVIIVETHDWMLPRQAVSSTLLRALGGKRRDLLFKGENLFSIRVD
jgi:FkbM family methyltransferase